MTEEKGFYSLRRAENRKAVREGFHAGIPIGLGYLAVAFSLGIIAKNAGLTPFQGFLASFFCMASAGEYAGFTLIAAGAGYVEMALMIFVANARYLLMSCAMSQRMKPGISGGYRALMAFYITDEIFAAEIARPGYLNPNFTIGAALFAGPMWSVGTALGCIAGNLMPERLVSAFSVALYGMFLAVIIPAAKESRIIAGLIAVCFVCSFLASYLPAVSQISSGTRTIVLTVVIASAAALLFPRKEESEGTA